MSPHKQPLLSGLVDAAKGPYYKEMSGFCFWVGTEMRLVEDGRARGEEGH